MGAWSELDTEIEADLDLSDLDDLINISLNKMAILRRFYDFSSFL